MAKFESGSRNVFESLLADAGFALALVGIDNMSTGEPVVHISFPKNPNGADFAYIKSALREHHVIVRFSSPNGREFVEVRVNDEDAVFNSARPKKKRFFSEHVK